MRAVFSKKCLHDIYTFYLHYFMFLTITFETYNNIGSKTKALFILNKKFRISLRKYRLPQKKTRKLINNGRGSGKGGF